MESDKLRPVIEKAVEILLRNRGKWSNEIDAYWLLVKNEDELGWPVTYDIVEAAVERARLILSSSGKQALEEYAPT